MVRSRNPSRTALAAGAVMMLLAAGSLAAFDRPAEASRTFFLLVDAVPYSAVAALHEGGSAPELFAELGPPVPLISTFPSTTTVALAAALEPFGLEISPGYEARFFDWREERVRGGGAISYFRIDFPWRGFFDWSRKGFARSAFASLRPVDASENRTLSALQAFLKSKKPDFFAYIETTDTAAHLRGPSSLDAVFRDLGSAIRSARAAGEEFHVVLFSDHGIDGGEPLTNVLPGIRENLERSGLTIARRLSEPRDVVLTPYGLVSSFEAYAHDEIASLLAENLVAVEGVGLCAFHAQEQLWVVSPNGSATIAARGTGAQQEWTYRPVEGDPLRYKDAMLRIRAGMAVPPDEDWFSDRQWFEATELEFYPDALRRIARGFELVENPATVICSAEPGYMYGPKRTERAARMTAGRLRWTHGALFWNASAGFLMTDLPGLSAGRGVRLSDALFPLGSSPLARLARSGEADPEVRGGPGK